MISPFRLAPRRVPVVALSAIALLLPLLALLALGVVFSTTKSSQPTCCAPIPNGTRQIHRRGAS